MHWNNCFSHGRFGQGYISAQPRTPYERDFDRLIFSAAFRRLQDKTQVFPLPGPILVHNRLTHSLEVASVGRSLGKLVGEKLVEVLGTELNEAGKHFYTADLSSVVAAACLAHDIGNPSFGHSGEAAISAYFIQNGGSLLDGQPLQQHFSAAEWQDITHFEGNANAFRILTHPYANRQKGGYQLTYTTLASIAKYPCESLATDPKLLHCKKYGFFQTEKESFMEVAQVLGMQPQSLEPLVYHRHPFVFLVEAADDICYRVIDWEDAHRLGIIDSDTAIGMFLELLGSSARENKERIHSTLKELEGDTREQLAYLRAKCINFLALSCVEVFISNRNEILTGMYNRSLIDGIEPASLAALEAINKVTVKKIYNHETVVKIELAGYEVMSALLQSFIPAVLHQSPSHREKKVLKLLPAQFGTDDGSPYDKALSVIDFISGMTDSYAMELYKNLRGISLPTHT
ncbi:deoxyguanosinetriphosphate triphosphohydrolase [Flavihumibacter stibioxidans]|uniref:Deoxyguanosinetriphosphate triphosphohydrolase n=2 Tax=Flavihumibacter stibioxidans TaxID=1834163 RepID=A0ABR7MD10_9BACT|nr:deoxyguanosinetriphosphate triphosphohydrolase [Flavihumibacter stibioxidans]